MKLRLVGFEVDVFCITLDVSFLPSVSMFVGNPRAIFKSCCNVMYKFRWWSGLYCRGGGLSPQPYWSLCRSPLCPSDVASGPGNSRIILQTFTLANMCVSNQSVLTSCPVWFSIFSSVFLFVPCLNNRQRFLRLKSIRIPLTVFCPTLRIPLCKYQLVILYM